MRRKIGFSLFLWLASYAFSIAQTSSLVSLGANGKLIYSADSKGNIVPDFSGVGYMNSESAIPTIAVVKTVYAVSGDNLSNIQTAINEVAVLTPDANGFRGAILFKAGTYNVSNTITINTSGIVLKGEGFNGSGTNFIATKTAQHTLFNFAGSSGTGNSSSSIKAITDAYVPVGAKQVTVAAGHTFAVGNNVFIHRVPNQTWISFLKMDILSTLPGADAFTVNWTPAAYDIYYERKVTAVNGNVISFDAPVMDVIDPLYATGEVVKFNDYRIQKCGIENMRISSTYVSATDENHGWEAVAFENIINGWATNLEVYYFGYSAVHVNSHASYITVDACKMLDAKSTVDGGRRYSFNVDGQRTLIKNCTTRNGRHDYVNGSITAGPNVFYNCTSTLQLNDIGPHHRWSTGILFDQITGDGRMDVQNRTISGTGHGWSGSQIMFWNCMGSTMVLQDPPGDHRNWAIGFKGTINNVGDMTTEPMGFVESNGTPITAIPSLFIAQLNERLNFSALPIELRSFKVKPLLRSNLISWSTVSESNNHIFLVEHSVNGVDFKTIGEIDGAGNSSQIINYAFEHQSPAKGINYYRLKQIDFDGSEKIVDPIAINLGFSASDMEVSYDRTSSTIFVNITVLEESHGNLNLYNLTGQKIATQNINLNQGLNHLTFAIPNFVDGVYVLSYNSGVQIINKKIIKQ